MNIYYQKKHLAQRLLFLAQLILLHGSGFLLASCSYGGSSIPVAGPTSDPAATIVPTQISSQLKLDATRAAWDDARQTALATRLASGTPYAMTPFPIATRVPLPTPVLGFSFCGEADHHFNYGNCWKGILNGQYIFATAGELTDQPGQGVLRIITGTLDLLELGPMHTYTTPARSGIIRITEIRGTRLTLTGDQPGTPATFVFDVATRRWVASSLTPQAPILSSPSP